MTVTCAAIAVARIFYPRTPPLCAIVILAVAVGLFGADYHFLGDIVAGSFVGVSTAWMATALRERRASIGL